ncbi:MAG: DNA-3-methyladenine glycosylase I [Phycisphaerales bacterium]|nr:DNA-3-methyladenine glycosylase I [Phycisphaerales bacterium]
MTVSRCSWCGDDPLYVEYHDTEWGVPIHDDEDLFAKLLLDGFQAGLSWITILRRREGFLAAMDGLDPQKIARYTPRRIEKLMQDKRIIRNRQKVVASVRNAQAWLEVMDSGSFAELLWDHVGGSPRINRRNRSRDIPTETEQSRAMSRQLKKLGFGFCGPTICYAFMQATGMVNDHLVSCFRHPELS